MLGFPKTVIKLASQFICHTVKSRGIQSAIYSEYRKQKLLQLLYNNYYETPFLFAIQHFNYCKFFPLIGRFTNLNEFENECIAD